MKWLLNFFRESGQGSSVKDGWTQDEREALIDLLLFTMYVDNQLSIAEDKMLDEDLGELEWDSSESINSYVDRNIPRIRILRTDETRRTQFFESLRNRFASYDSRQRALNHCQNLARVEGTVASEKEFMDKVKAYLD